MPLTIENLPSEEWSLVSFPKPTRRNIYFVSSLGRVKSVNKNTQDERLIKTRADHRGFQTASIKLDGGFSAIYVHKEVALAFIEPPSEDHKYVIHPHHKRDRNSTKDLKWVTEEEWKLYVKERKKIYGFKTPKGGGNKKLTEAQVALIKRALINGKTRKKMIAKRFGVSSTQIKRIEREENWAHIKPAD